MRRIFFTTLVLFMLCLTMSAQKKAKHIEPGNGQAWWGYYLSGKYYGDFGDVGLAAPCNYMCAIKVPADNPVCKGKTVSAMRIWLAEADHIKNLKIWASKTLPKTWDKADINITDAVYNPLACTDCAFSEPIVMGDDDVYFGYSFSVDEIESEGDQYPIYLTPGDVEPIPEGLFMKYYTDDQSPDTIYWRSNKQSLKENGYTLAMMIMIGDDLYNNAASLTFDTRQVAALDSTCLYPVTLTNLCGQPIQEIKFQTIIDGVEGEERTVDLSQDPINDYTGTASFQCPVPAAKTIGVKDLCFKVTQVNGKANEALDKEGTFTGKLLTVAKAPKHRVLFETFVKNQDGYSVMPYVGDNRLRRNHGDSYLGVMIHDLDPMETDIYEDICYTLPSPWMHTFIERCNRMYHYWGSQYDDPYARRCKFGIEDDFQEALKKTPEADVALRAEWTDADSTAVDVETSLTFQYDSEDTPYALMYILCEDSVCGEGEEWAQVNNVMPMMKNVKNFDWDIEITRDYIDGPDPMYGYAYNNVLVAAYGRESGIEGSVPSTFKCGEPVKHVYHIDLSDNQFIQRKHNVTLTAALLNTETGKVINANRVCLGDNEWIKAGIEQVENGKTGMEDGRMFNLLGQKVSSASKGIIISNGKKVLK